MAAEKVYVNEHLDPVAIDDFLSNPAPHYDWVPAVLDCPPGECVVYDQTYRASSQQLSVQHMPPSLRHRLISDEISEVQLRDLTLHVLLHLCTTLAPECMFAQEATVALSTLIKSHLPGAQRAIQEMMSRKPVDVDDRCLGNEAPLQQLACCLIAMDLPSLRRQAEDLESRARMLLVTFLRLRDLPFCGCTRQTIFTIFPRPPPYTFLREYKQFLAEKMPEIFTQLDCTPMIRQPRRAKVNEPAQEPDPSKRDMFMQWATLLGTDPRHVSVNPFSSNSFVGATTKLFLVGLHCEPEITAIIAPQAFSRILWIHPNPHLVTDAEDNITLYRPEDWRLANFQITDETDLVIFSMLTLILHELPISLDNLFQKIACCCIMTDIMLSPIVAPFTTPGSIYLFPSTTQALVHIHESAESIDKVTSHLMAAPPNVAHVSHGFVVARKHNEKSNLSWWDFGEGAVVQQRDTHFTDVVLDLDPGLLDDQLQFVVLMSKAFALSSPSASFHIRWKSDQMRRVVLMLVAFFDWKPRYSSRHSYLAWNADKTKDVAKAHPGRKRKRDDVPKTRMRAEAVHWSLTMLLSTSDFALIASVTILKRILLVAEVAEEDFILANRQKRYAFDMDSTRTNTLSKLWLDLKSLNRDMGIAHPQQETTAVALMKRVALPFGRVCAPVVNSRPSVYHFLLRVDI